MTQATVTFCLSYYNQPLEAVKRHMDWWSAYPAHLREKLRFQIIDDCSKKPINRLIDFAQYQSLDCDLYRVTQDLVCNIGGVRNLAAQKCKTDWMLILDMDTCVSVALAHEIVALAASMPPKTVANFIRTTLDSRHPKNEKKHPAVCLIRVCDYWSVGGCDEDFVGAYGQTDPHFWYRAEKLSIERMVAKSRLHYFDDGEATINRDRTRNEAMFAAKKKTGKWSTDYVRFPWEHLRLRPRGAHDA